MLPLLSYLKDGGQRTVRECVDEMIHHFELSEEEKREKLENGQQIIYMRVSWARTYLKKALLIESPLRGKWIITQRGIELVNENPSEINKDILMKYVEFNDFVQNTLVSVETQIYSVNQVNTDQAPEEEISRLSSMLKKQLAEDLLETIKSKSPDFFEKLVVDVIVAMGYGGSVAEAGKAIGRTGDEGIDGVINEDRLGLERIYIQAKRWSESVVSRPEIQKFVGALAGKHARKGIFITTTDFSKSAREYIESLESKVVLINGIELANYMIELGVGVHRYDVVELKRVDLDYFSEDGE